MPYPLDVRRPAVAILALGLAACAGPTAADLPPTTTTVAATTAATTTDLDPRDLYVRVSPSLAFVGTEIGSGSGVLVDDRHVVTNLHVVWPEEFASVRFADGTSLEAAPVVGVDVLADLAVLDVSAAGDLPPPLRLPEEISIEIGSRLYLIGYPADATDEPEPAITGGVLSRRRRWDGGGLDFLQSDAVIEGGQSGGALVSARGELVGISGLGLGEGFALALAAPIVRSRVAAILEGDDPAGLGDRSVEALRASTPGSEAILPNPSAEAVFVFDGREGDRVEFDLEPASRVAGALIGPDGYVEAATEDEGPAVLTADLVLDGVYFLSVTALDGADLEVTVSTEVTLYPFADPDHGRPLRVGGGLTANTDYPGDWDWFALDLHEGDTVVIRVTSTNMDAGIAVHAPDGSPAEPLATDSDSAGGVLGVDAEVEFTAPVSGTYQVVVLDEVQFGPGAYVVTVEAA